MRKLSGIWRQAQCQLESGIAGHAMGRTRVLRFLSEDEWSLRPTRRGRAVSLHESERPRCPRHRPTFPRTAPKRNPKPRRTSPDATSAFAPNRSEAKSEASQDQARRHLCLRPGPFRGEIRSPAVRLAVPTRLRPGPFRGEIRSLAARPSIPLRLRP